MDIEQIYKAICEAIESADKKEMNNNRVYNEFIGNLEMAKFDAEILLGKKDWPRCY